MKRFIKTVFIVGLVGLGTFGIACAVLGKHRTKDAIKSLQKMAQSEVDQLIKQQADMKEQLAKLREQYPKQVAALRSQQLEVEQQLKALEKEAQRCTDIVALCDEDIATLNKQRAAVGAAYDNKATIAHRGSRYTPNDAETLVVRISQTREIYVNRLTDMQSEREVLAAEKAQVATELEVLQTEQAEFEAEYQSLVREIDRLKRNQDMLESTQHRRGVGCDKHGESMETLAKVRSALDKARMEQEERMKSLKVLPRQQDYESRAKLLELERSREAKRKTASTPEVPEAQPDEEKAASEEEELELAFWK